MLNYIEVRADNGMKISSKDIFNKMTDEDFIYLHQQGELLNLCHALSIDLHSKQNNPYEA